MWDDVFKHSTLIVVDAQQGFSELCPDELPVPGATGIVRIINRLLAMPWYSKQATIDWHPKNHSSFKQQGGLYPPHCVQGTKGAEFLPGLWTEYFHAILRKGFRTEIDAYSAALDHPGWPKSLLSVGHVKGNRGVYLCGLCTNICVYETACDFVRAGHNAVHIIEDACVALSLPENSPYHTKKVRQKAEDIGIKFIKAEAVLPLL